MKKSELVDMVLELNRQPNKADINRGLVSRAIGMSLNSIFYEIFKQDPAYLSDYLVPFSLTPVKYNEEISIITLPVNTLQFPSIGDFVRISSQTDTSLLFVPVRIGEIELIQDIQQVDAVIPFTVKNDKIWLYGLTTIQTLLVECIPEFHELSDDDQIKIPSGVDLKLMQSVKEMLYGAK